ncbi:uncharacterized protein LOC142992630 [Genypterus blacodes]|uniref:uncharacterized protein LOC142992630 n=1 Tax=Genypterus blacodes TaxID=154954 RepID=UPI003F75991C
MDDAHPALRSSRPELQSFLAEMIQWFTANQDQVEKRLSLCDTDRSGSVHLRDAEPGLMDLNVPCQQFQLHMLTQLLKTTNDMIKYTDFSGQLRQLSLSETKDLDSQKFDEDVRKGSRDVKTAGVYGLENRFVYLSVRLIPFDSGVHPGNFEVFLSSSSRVFSLISIIQDRVGIQTWKMEVFRSRDVSEEARLAPESSLEECGFLGGPEESPPEFTLFYDYRPPLADCPILNCDHYFGSNHR